MDASNAPDSLRRQGLWKVVSTATGLVGALITRKILRALWGIVRKEPDTPVLDPADRRFSWTDAVLWTITAGVGMGIAKVVSARIAVAGWEVATGTLPPGVEEPADVV